jgi:prefoldin subunit 5
MNTEKDGEKNIYSNEKENSKMTTLNKNNNDKAIYGNNNIISDINLENGENKYSKTYNKKKEINYNEEFDNNTQVPKLNYLNEFYSTIPQDKESTLLKEHKSSNNKERKNTDKDNEEESIKDELEDEVGSIDEFHNINDNRSIISSYIFTSVHLTERRSIAQSTYSKSEYQDGISNYNDLTSSRGGLNFIHSLTNNKEFEFRIDKDANFIPFLKETKNFQFKHNFSIIYNMQINNSIKKLKEKIEDKSKMINDNKKEINELKEKIRNVEEENKQYEGWIENEEAEKEELTCFLNFLMGN